MTEQKKIRLGILSDSPFLNTGYSSMSFQYANACAEAGMEVFYFGCNYIGQELPPGVKLKDGTEFKFHIVGQGKEQYFKDLLERKVKELKLDVLFILLDTFMLYPWLPILDLAPAKKVFMFPSDGGSGLPLNCESILKAVDMPIAMAKYGQKQVKKMYDINAEHIPHGVDTKNYYPLSQEEKLKLKEKWGLKDKFVIGTVARNQGRKMLDRTIKAFALYSKMNPNAVLLLHLDPNDNAAPYPIQALIQRYDIGRKVFYTGVNFFNGFSYKQMNEVYNTMDVFLLTTSGEGFGVPLIEAQACGVPVLATNYTTTRELVLEPNTGLGINLVDTMTEENPDVHCDEIIDGTITGSWAVERGICSIKDCALKLSKLEDDELRKKLGENGVKNVKDKYSWDVICPNFVKLIQKLGNEY